jgi:small subunit ribosomal protein S4
MYGLREEQFQRLVERAVKSRGQTGLVLLKFLERRLDNIVYRLGLARTRPQARQFVTHGLVHVNGERINIPSYQVRVGEEIALKEAARQIPTVMELAEANVPVPDWSERRNGGGVILREPERNEIAPDIQEQRIVEFFSR